MKAFIILLFIPLFCFSQKPAQNEMVRLTSLSKKVQIIRDNFGIPHIYGKTDADAVFGLLYAQCEDDFPRIEMNYIEKLGRLSEVNGERDLFNDLQIRMMIDSTEAIADYNKAEPWLKKLMNAYADGINYYLATHPNVKPALLTKFKPWYSLLWTDGSIGAISTGGLSIGELRKFYTGDFSPTTAMASFTDQQTGSNGFALGPSKTASGNAILYINPHVTFYFRPEVHVNSEEGLNAYGAVTWGQFFVYQGFNPYCGWMHTSSAVDVADMYAEKVTKKEGKYYYDYDAKLLPVKERKIAIQYKDGATMKTKIFNTYYTHHGPVMAIRDGKWISLRSYNRSVKSLMQSYLRTKARGLEDYKKTMDLQANTSNNTVFADNKGNIAYWHGNFIPKRDANLDWASPVDGTISSTEWKGLHSVEESVHIYNPVSGWIQNCNSTPFTAAGASSPKKENYPVYMAPDGENFRALTAAKVLSQGKNYTIDKVITSGYDNYLSAFEVLIPPLIAAFEKNDNPAFADLAKPIELLKKWDYRSGVSSMATTLAVEWAQKLNSRIQKVYINPGEADQVLSAKRFANTATADQLLQPLHTVILDLTKKFGTWEVAWGDINRFQRLSSDINDKFDDNQPSIPVGFASALWGQLPSFNSRSAGTNKRYGYSGNSFICAVEFGPRIKAKSLLAGGESGTDPKHFTDQAEMYASGKFKDVLFYKEDVLKHAERTYHPGQK